MIKAATQRILEAVYLSIACAKAAASVRDKFALASQRNIYRQRASVGQTHASNVVGALRWFAPPTRAKAQTKQHSSCQSGASQQPAS